jgi:tryptophan synthase beta chain
MPTTTNNRSTSPGRFGPFGRQYVPEVLMGALQQLEAEYARAKADPSFWAELDEWLKHYAGRPSPLYFARRLTERAGGGFRRAVQGAGRHGPGGAWTGEIEVR